MGSLQFRCAGLHHGCRRLREHLRGGLIILLTQECYVTWLRSQGTECGQGLDTKVAQVAALAFGIPIGGIKVQPTDAFINPNNAPTGGSVGSEICCMGLLARFVFSQSLMLASAVQDACDTLNASINQVRQTMSNPTWQELVNQCYNLGVSLSAKVILL